MSIVRQSALFGREPTADFDRTFSRCERVVLGDGAWLDIARGWVSGHEALFDRLACELRWESDEREMYERTVQVPRLLATLPEPVRPPIVEHMRVALSERYRVQLVRVSAALYRDGADSVAWHGDYVARELPIDTVVATVSLGAPRTFRVRRKGGGAPSLAWTLGWGDLLVMGGSSQRTHEHAVPKVRASAAPRIALMFRPIWERP